MKRKISNRGWIAIGILVLIVALAIGVTVAILSSRKDINPPGTIGNTSGNLNNNGYFCQDGDTVYFANSYAGGALFRMTVEEEDITRMYNLKCRNILSGGNYLYAFELGTTSKEDFQDVASVATFMKFKKNRIESESFLRSTVLAAQLVDNNIYLETIEGIDVSLTKIDTNKSNREVLAHYQLNPACVHDSIIYFNGTQINHDLYTLDTTTDEISHFAVADMWNPTYYNGYLYYMDVAHNYRLCRMDLVTGNSEVLTEDRIDCFNVGYGFIYYQKNSKKRPVLKMMTYDGKEEAELIEGNFTAINMTSRYVYFQEFGDEIRTYHSPIGSTVVSEFILAREYAK